MLVFDHPHGKAIFPNVLNVLKNIVRMSQSGFCVVGDIFRNVWRPGYFQRTGKGQILYLSPKRRQSSGITDQAAHLQCTG